MYCILAPDFYQDALRCKNKLDPAAGVYLHSRLDALKRPAYGLSMDKFAALNILSLGPGATRSEVKTAYRRLAKSCHPDRFVGRPGAAAAEERMKLLNQAFALLMAVLPPEKEAEPQAPPEKKPAVEPVGPGKSSFFSVFRKKAAGRRTARHQADPGRNVSDAGTRRARSPLPKRRTASVKVSFESVLNGTAEIQSGQPVSNRKTTAVDPYARYVHLKQRMQARKRRSGQSVISRVEKISPVRPVNRVGDND